MADVDEDRDADFPDEVEEPPAPPETRTDLAVFFGALALFLLTLCRTPYPGDAAAWTAAVGGLSPLPPMTHPAYAGLARWIARIPVGALSERLAVFNALCAATAVLLLGRVARAFPPIEPARPNDHIARRLSGVVASFALAFAFPFWFAATRASPEPLALAILLAALEFLIRFENTGRAHSWGLFAFFLVLAAAEHAAALYLAPIVLLAAAVILLRRAAPRHDGLLPESVERAAVFRRLAGALPFAFAGLLPWIYHALWYSRQPAAEWRQLQGFGAVALDLARAHYHSAANALPPVGWLLIVVGAAGPALWLAIVPFLTLRVWFIRPGHAALSVAFAGLGLAMVLLDALAPAMAASLLMPRAMAAAAAAFSLGRLAAWARRPPRRRFLVERGFLASHRIFWRGAMTIFAAGLLAAPMLNGRLIRSAARQRYTDYARDVVRLVGHREWLLLESPEDDLIAVALAEAGLRTRALQPAMDMAPAYRRYLASRFADPRRRDLALLGIAPLLSEWMGREPWGNDEIAVLGFSEPWRAAGRRVIPNGPLAHSADEGPVPDLEMLARRNFEFALRYEGLAESAAREPWPWTARWNALVAARVSRAANNTGVLLEEEGRPDLAAEAYAVALRVHPENLSALMNAALLGPAERDAPPTVEEARLRKAADRFHREGVHLNAWRLIRNFGEVRRPDVLTRRGLLWSQAGRFAAAEADWRRAGEAAAPLRRALAMRGADAQSAAALRDLAEQDDSPAAWLALFRLHLRRSDLAAAEEALERAAAAGADAALLARERALLDWTAGRRAEARQSLQTLIRSKADDYEAIALLAAMAAEAGEDTERDRLLARLREAGPALSPDVLLTVARIELARGAVAPARKALERVWRARPGDRDAQMLLLQADVLEGRRDDALARVGEILATDPRQPFANQVLGSIRIHDGDYAAAEAALRRSLEAERDPAALNDLAYALTRLNRPAEAIAPAREAIERAPAMATAWDTLGDALRRAGRPAEAEAALRRSLELAPDQPVALWNLALTLEDLRRPIEAREIFATLMPRAQELPPLLRRELEERARMAP